MAGPLAAARVRWEDWAGVSGSQLLYADLDLVERSSAITELRLDRDVGDDAIVVAAYRRWGEACGNHLGGQFAFALWDGERGRLVAVRDPIGLRPLVYARMPNGIVLGGDIRGVLATDGVSDVIDEDVFVACVLWNHTDLLNRWGRTCYRDVDTVRPAYALVAGPDNCRQTRYWDPADVRVVKLGRPRAYVAALRDLLDEVVRDLTPIAGVLGSHLSGGIDSSGITALAARTRAEIGAAPPMAFAWQPGPDLGRGLDHERIESVSDLYRLPLVYSPSTVESHTAEIMWDATREPSTMIRSELPVQQAASELGVPTILSGYGGDDAVTFSGRGQAVRYLLRQGRFASVGRMAVTHRSGLRELAAAVIPHRTVRRGWYQTIEERRAEVMAGTLPSLLRPEVVQRAELPGSPLPPRDPYARMQWLFDFGHLATRAADWARSGAAMGIAYRYPLLDRRLIRFSLGLPAHLWLRRDGHRRWLIRAALEGWLPNPARMSDKIEAIGLAHHQVMRREALPCLPVDLASADPQRMALFDTARIESGLEIRDGRATGARGQSWSAFKWLGLERPTTRL